MRYKNDFYSNDYLVCLRLSGLHISDLFEILRLLRVRDGERGEGAVPGTKHDRPPVVGRVETSQVSLDHVLGQLGSVSQAEEENTPEAGVVVNHVLVSLAGGSTTKYLTIGVFHGVAGARATPGILPQIRLCQSDSW